MHLLIGIGALLIAGILIKISNIFIPLSLAITLFITVKAIKHCRNKDCLSCSWLTGHSDSEKGEADQKEYSRNKNKSTE